MKGSDDGGVMNMTWTSPAISPVMAGAAPRYGTCTICVRVSDLNSSAARWSPLPTPGEPNENLAVGAPRQHDQLLHRAHRQGGIDPKDVGFGYREIAYGLEVVDHVEWQLFVEARIDDEQFDVTSRV